jgi:hypothetical protein
MSEPRLIRDYLAVLSARLPGSITEELAGGLAETYQAYLRRGQAPDAAARSAVAEFGDPYLIAAEFTRVNPARRAARRLLVTGPVVGACWAAALITSQAQNWPVPLPARIMLGLALAAVVALIAVAALGTRCRLAARTGLAGCIGITALDVLMISGVLLAAPAMTWVTIAAIAASTARITVSTTTLRPLLAR